ncbi:1,4-beta-xylanase [Oceanibium sediminis]|uniref:1,4-beta-xylanase n=1 Tax=Oceanibium sediminis TaxID=2026339 RepID=UPI000DD3996E|nr:1,4-beta-xylanase [Oceanibium sediminis]
MDRWTEAEARAWWQARQWVCGCNYLPSSAVNFIEMWHPDSFDPEGIQRELGWAAEVGFNAIRINLPFLGWRHDRDGLIDRLDRVMGIAARLGIDTVPCLFDDCGFGGDEPVWGLQPAPVPGVHNSRAVASPGRAAVLDPGLRPALELYVRDMIATFRTDERILFWDLYNEPGNRMDFANAGYGQFSPELERHALTLMEQSFAWARAEAPAAPLSVAVWTTPLPQEDAHPYQTGIDRSALLHSDIITFHAYWNRARVAQFIDYLEVLDRPILCTEWMARAVDSRISDQLQLFHERNVGCFQWGLVKGRTQTWLPWPNDLVLAHGGQPGVDLWFHDLLHEDGRPYDPREVETILALTQSETNRTDTGSK